MICLTYTQASWTAYIDDVIYQSRDSSGHASADEAAIIAIDGGAKWTTDVSMKSCMSVQQFSTVTRFMNIHVIPIRECGSYESVESASVHIFFVSESSELPNNQRLWSTEYRTRVQIQGPHTVCGTSDGYWSRQSDTDPSLTPLTVYDIAHHRAVVFP